jgi:hypothetical protein
VTAAVAGRAAASAGGAGAAAETSAGGRAASGAARRPTRSGRAPRPNIDEREANAARRAQARQEKKAAETRDRGDRAAGDFRKRYQMDGGKRAEKEPAKQPVDDDDDGGGEQSSSGRTFTVPSPVQGGAGFLLAVLAWGWIALPFLKDGPAGVRAVLMAKFLNKSPDGSWLP